MKKVGVLALVLAAVLVVLLLPSDGSAMQFDSSPVIWPGVLESPLDPDGEGPYSLQDHPRVVPQRWGD